jgi:TatD DNase family protein
MHLVDTHTHLYLPEFNPDRDEVILRAIDQGVEKFFLPNIDSASMDSMLELAGRYPEHCFPMIGLHPTSVKGNYLSELEVVQNQLQKKSFYAIGEVGIDLYWDKTHETEQIIVFKEQVNLALKYSLPLVIHSRNSFNLIVSILKEYNSPELQGVFHSFTGDTQQVEQAVALGFKLGIGGIVTFKNSGLDDVVRNVDLTHIVLETDSPYLAPAPKRGKRNESSYLVHIAEKIAQIHRLNVTQVAEATTLNAMKLFGMDNTPDQADR